MEQRKGALEGLVLNGRFWKGRRVLVTGSAGFKGTWLSLWLEHLGARWTGYSLTPETRPVFLETLGPSLRKKTVPGDIRDTAKLDKVFSRSRPEVVLHLAAQSLVRRSYRDPVETFSTNVAGTAAVLEVCRRYGVRSAVVVSSDKCYAQDGPHGPYREDDRLGGHDPYSASKACTELVTGSFRDAFGSKTFGIASARAGNVIGGGDWSEDRLVPDFVRALRARRKLRLRYPQAVRPWQHVLEPLSGYLMLAERLFRDPARYHGPWNFGPERSSFQEVSRVVERLAQAWGAASGWEREKGRQPHEAAVLTLDSTKARRFLGWRPRWRLETALDRTADWYLAYYKKDNMLRHSLAEIESYERSAAI